jgi:short subunit fatty acids transporter
MKKIATNFVDLGNNTKQSNIIAVVTAWTNMIAPFISLTEGSYLRDALNTN